MSTEMWQSKIRGADRSTDSPEVEQRVRTGSHSRDPVWCARSRGRAFSAEGKQGHTGEVCLGNVNVLQPHYNMYPTECGSSCSFFSGYCPSS